MKYAPIALLLVACSALAGPTAFNASWTVPKTRVNGDALAANEIKGFELYYAIDGGQNVTIPVSNTQTASRVTINLAGRAAPYKIVWTISAIDVNGLKGALSQPVTTTVTVPISAPSTPTSFTIKVSCTEGQCTAVVE